MKLKIAAIVPMRHNSERVPGKNYRSFGGQPLYRHIINSLLSCPLIDEVIIDTDSPTIFNDVSNNFPQVKLIERPEHLRSGSIPMNDVLLHSVNQVEADFYLQTHSTNPLLTSDTITKAIVFFIENYPLYDSLFFCHENQQQTLGFIRKSNQP
ncbi:cytidylyltransferase domain-containing protein [Methanogenium cariaci]|uniref:cytidylyltransferase domain-containing protein n=1 Tax=Methanogenium cariaci TaxID=2197 RepID=UPI000AEFD657|nr:hypothetical protein [Methanogenium cariaci]